MGNWSPRIFTWGGFSSSHPPTPSNTAKIDAHLRKNRLKRPEIKQGTTSKVNCILFNRLLNPVLLNKSGLVRAKASNFNLKSLNRCFSNYYQVRTMHIFAEPVTNGNVRHFIKCFAEIKQSDVCLTSVIEVE